jgi:hypothetical protein
MKAQVCGQEYKVKTHKNREGKETFEVKLLRSSMGPQIADLRRRRDEVLLATLANGKGKNLSRDQIIQRASMERTFKDKRVWVRLRSNGKELGEFFCLGFDAQDMHARCVDRGNRLHVFDPGNVEFETRAERTLRFAKDRSKKLNHNIEELRATVERMNAEKDRIDRMIRRTDNELKRERKRSHLSRFLKDELKEEKDGNP